MKISELKPGKLYKCIEQITFMKSGTKEHNTTYSDDFDNLIFIFLHKEIAPQKENYKYHYLIGNKLYYNWIGREDEIEVDWYEELTEKA